MAIKEITKNLKQILLSIIAGLIFGIIVGAGFTYQYITQDHAELHKTEIGYFVFIKNKVYNLTELKNLD